MYPEELVRRDFHWTRRQEVKGQVYHDHIFDASGEVHGCVESAVA